MTIKFTEWHLNEDYPFLFHSFRLFINLWYYHSKLNFFCTCDQHSTLYKNKIKLLKRLFNKAIFVHTHFKHLLFVIIKMDLT